MCTPSAIFDQQGNVIAVPSSAGGPVERYAHLVAQGRVKLKPFTTADLHAMPYYQVPGSVDPLAQLLAEREESDRSSGPACCRWRPPEPGD